jgi:uridine phosphorylase
VLDEPAERMIICHPHGKEKEKFVNPGSLSVKRIPHLTPASLVGRQFGRDTFNGMEVALVGYCPRPRCLDKYDVRDMDNQYFIHVPPANVQIARYQDVEFFSITHVYGGPVSSALVEELAYYGIKYILAYGLAGGLGTKDLKMGDFYLIEKALALDGTTPHYTSDKLISSDETLNSKIQELARKMNFKEIIPVQAMTGDAIYREYDEDLEYAKENGCDIVNCDSSHLFAVSREVGIRSTECGVLSDVATGTGKEWQSTLSGMLSAQDQTTPDPMTLVGKIVEFYVKVLLPKLVRG